MEKDNDSWSCAEFANELGEDNRYHVSYFIKEYSNSIDERDSSISENGTEFDLAISGCNEQVGGLEAIGRLGTPLIFFTKSPKDEDEGENGSEE